MLRRREAGTPRTPTLEKVSKPGLSKAAREPVSLKEFKPGVSVPLNGRRMGEKGGGGVK